VQVLSEVPWVGPKPLYLLSASPPAASASPGSDAPAPGAAYTLRTRVARQDQEEELSRVLRRRAADGAPLIRCSEMKDGVVAFEDEADAERYGQMLEADGGGEVRRWRGGREGGRGKLSTCGAATRPPTAAAAAAAAVRVVAEP
jgi:hypothetical protein